MLKGLLGRVSTHLWQKDGFLGGCLDGYRLSHLKFFCFGGTLLGGAVDSVVVVVVQCKISPGKRDDRGAVKVDDEFLFTKERNWGPISLLDL